MPFELGVEVSHVGDKWPHGKDRESFRGSVGKPRGPAAEHLGSGKQLRKKEKVCISE